MISLDSRPVRDATKSLEVERKLNSMPDFSMQKYWEATDVPPTELNVLRTQAPARDSKIELYLLTKFSLPIPRSFGTILLSVLSKFSTIVQGVLPILVGNKTKTT